MALVTDAFTHLIPPHEPESWFDVRAIKARDYGSLGGIDVTSLTAATAIEASLELLARVILRWSYDPPITAESVGDLDTVTYAWLVDAANLASGLRSLQEKKALAVALTPGPAPATANGRRN
jgi:hypothetical protein